MLVTDIRHDVARSVHRRLDDLPAAELDSMFRALEGDAQKYAGAELAGESDSKPTFVRRLDLRYVGQFHPLTLAIPAKRVDIPKLFHAAHLERYGHNAPAEPIEVIALRVTAVIDIVKPDSSGVAEARAGEVVKRRSRKVMFEDGEWHECQVWRRHELTVGQTVVGPAIIEDADTNIVLGPSDQGQVLAGGHLMIEVGGSA
jgi:N-methylhydantoinase A